MNTGDDRARFAEFYSANARWLTERAFRLCRDWHDAEDLAQTALLKVYLRWNALERHDELRPYAAKLLVNGYIDYRRKWPWGREQSCAEIPERAVAGEWWVDDSLAGLLSVLPVTQRAIVYLRFCMDLDVAEVAARVGCSHGSVTSQSSRGLARLRATVQPG